jgi:hypothetical protein
MAFVGISSDCFARITHDKNVISRSISKTFTPRQGYLDCQIGSRMTPAHMSNGERLPQRFAEGGLATKSGISDPLGPNRSSA